MVTIELLYNPRMVANPRVPKAYDVTLRNVRITYQKIKTRQRKLVYSETRPTRHAFVIIVIY